jgi:hypothetical protein
MNEASYSRPVEGDCFVNCKDSDVLSGRGRGTNEHPGNKFFRALILSYRDIYESATRSKKPLVSVDIVRDVRNRGGRFLRKDKKDGLFYEINDNAAREKASQALRHTRSLETRSKDHLKILKDQTPKMMGPQGHLRAGQTTDVRPSSCSSSRDLPCWLDHQTPFHRLQESRQQRGQQHRLRDHQAQEQGGQSDVSTASQLLLMSSSSLRRHRGGGEGGAALRPTALYHHGDPAARRDVVARRPLSTGGSLPLSSSFPQLHSSIYLPAGSVAVGAVDHSNTSGAVTPSSVLVLGRPQIYHTPNGHSLTPAEATQDQQKGEDSEEDRRPGRATNRGPHAGGTIMLDPTTTNTTRTNIGTTPSRDHRAAVSINESIFQGQEQEGQERRQQDEELLLLLRRRQQEEDEEHPVYSAVACVRQRSLLFEESHSQVRRERERAVRLLNPAAGDVPLGQSARDASRDLICWLQQQQQEQELRLQQERAILLGLRQEIFEQRVLLQQRRRQVLLEEKRRGGP